MRRAADHDVHPTKTIEYVNQPFKTTLGAAEADVPALVQPHLNVEATVESLLVLAQGLQERSEVPDLHKLGHLLYLADKMHLERFGRVISGDRFHALKYGPTPSATYGALKILAHRDPGFHPPEAFLSAMAGAFEHAGGFRYRPLRPADTDEISGSAVECLKAVLEQSRAWDFSDLTEATHDDAYATVWQRLANGAIPVEVIAESLDRGEMLLDHLRDPFPE